MGDPHDRTGWPEIDDLLDVADAEQPPWKRSPRSTAPRTSSPTSGTPPPVNAGRTHAANKLGGIVHETDVVTRT